MTREERVDQLTKVEGMIEAYARMKDHAERQIATLNAYRTDLCYAKNVSHIIPGEAIHGMVIEGNA